MRVRSVFLAAGFVAGVFAASEAQAEPGRATGNVNLRQCASTRCARVLTIPAGASVEVLGREGAWFRVEYRVVGYAYASYIDVGGYYVAPPLPPPIYYPEPYYYEYEPFPLPRTYRPYRQQQRHDHRGDDHSHDQGQHQGSGGFPHEGHEYHPPHNRNWPPPQNGNEPVRGGAPPPTLAPPRGAQVQPQEFQHHHEVNGQGPRPFEPNNRGDGGAGGALHEHRRHDGGGNCTPGDPNCPR